MFLAVLWAVLWFFVFLPIGALVLDAGFITMAASKRGWQFLVGLALFVGGAAFAILSITLAIMQVITAIQIGVS